MSPISRIAAALALIGAASPAMAHPGYPQPGCPQGMRLKMVCMSTPKAGDALFAASAFEGIGVCAGGGAVSLALITEGGEENFAATAKPLAKGVRYLFRTDYGLELSLTVPSASIPKNKKVLARLSIAEEDGTVSASTYTCRR